MNRVEFQAARSVLRWAGIGLMPNAESANRALSVLRGMPDSDPLVHRVQEVLGGLSRGILPHQRACQEASESLERLYDLEDNERPLEAPNG